MTTFLELLPGYKKSTLTYLLCQMVYFMKVKRNVVHIFCTRGPPQRLDYLYCVADAVYARRSLVCYYAVNQYFLAL